MISRTSGQKRKPDGDIEEVVRSVNNLEGLPISLLQGRIIQCLDFSAQGRLSQVSRYLRQSVGNSPMYRNVLQSSNLDTLPPSITCAARIAAAITNDNALCMTYMAEALASYSNPSRPPRFYIKIFLDQSIAAKNHLTPTQRIEHRMTMLWRLQLLGNPSMGESDRTLWDWHLRAADAPEISEGHRAIRKIEVLIRAVLGFCDPTDVQTAIAVTAGLLNTPTLPPPIRHIAEFLQTLLDPRIPLMNPWPRIPVRFAELNFFLNLIIQKQRLDAHGANKLIIVIPNPKGSPHVHALASIAMASEQLEKDADPINDKKICDALKTISARDLARQSVRQAALLLLYSFQLQGRYQGLPQYQNYTIATCALRHLNQPSPQVHGLPLKWAKDALVRLKVSDLAHGISVDEAFLFAHELSTEKRALSQTRFYNYAKAACRFISTENLALPMMPKFRDLDAVKLLLQLLLEETDSEVVLNIKGLLAQIYSADRGYLKYMSDEIAIGYANDVWEGSQPGSLRRCNAGIALAKLGAKGPTALSLQSTLRRINCLTAISKSSFFKQTVEAKLLLAGIRAQSTTARLPISFKDAIGLCLQVHRHPLASPEMKQKAISLIVHLEDLSQ